MDMAEGSGQHWYLDVAVDATEMDGAERTARCPVARVKDADIIKDLVASRSGSDHFKATLLRSKDRVQRVGKQ